MENINDSGNIFISLFNQRPRDNVTPRENFLTESFVYVLKKNVDFCKIWLVSILKMPVRHESLVIDTRVADRYQDDGGAGSIVYPDVEIVGTLENGEAFRILIENKWDSGYNYNQIKNYLSLFRSQCKNYMVFMCQNFKDSLRAANDHSDVAGIEFRSILWEDVYLSMNGCIDKSGLLDELMVFMEENKLSSGNILTEDGVGNYIRGVKFFDDMKKFVDKLLNDFDWMFVKKGFSAKITNRFGRVAIEFWPNNTKNNVFVSVGLLYNNKDHKIPFAKPSQESIDFILRVEANPNLGDARIRSLDILSSRVESIRKDGSIAYLLNDKNNRNPHTLFIAQKNFFDLAKKGVTQRDQIVSIFEQCNKWVSLLFDDTDLLSELLALSLSR
ncbi:hypothetical protein [Zavarzinia aquatilis]|uniref:hypothetical protein n=1 Tax=Zavarzinia aquatilis TaxID=2211142 RepID=UPI00105800DA|nr:hypothetical protein [Zavarzinia aquatilis]